MELARKLDIRESGRVAVIDPPVRFREDLEPLPPDVEYCSVEEGDLDCIVVFAKTRADLAAAMTPAVTAMRPTGSLWVAWPKQLSGYRTDVSPEVAQAAGMRFGLLDTRRLSINDGWTAMRFIVRLDDREAWSKRSFD
jgi:hypothetical protein